MYILDTDHLSVLDRGGANAQRLLQRLASVNSSQVTASIISYEEQMRGWLSYIAKAQTIERQVETYKQLKRQLVSYCAIPILEFDEQASQEFQRLKKEYPRERVSQTGCNGLKNCIDHAGKSSRFVDSQ